MFIGKVTECLKTQKFLDDDEEEKGSHRNDRIDEKYKEKRRKFSFCKQAKQTLPALGPPRSMTSFDRFANNRKLLTNSINKRR